MNIRDKILFEKPNHKFLKAIGVTSVDMHFHTCYSDSTAKISAVIKRAKEKGIGVAITDHNEIGGSLSAAKNIEGVMIIPGIEVSCRDGPHILLYFYSFREMKEYYDKCILPYRGLNPFMAISLKTDEVLENSKPYNCIRVAAHPYGYIIANSGLSKAIRKFEVKSDVMYKIDCLEVICGGMNRRLNKMAVEQAARIGKGYTGGTDGHSLFQLGNVLTVSYAETRDEFLDNLKKKKNTVVGKEFKMMPKILPISKIIKTHAIDYAVPTFQVQSKMLLTRAKHFRGRMADRFASNGVAKRINGMLHRKS